MPDHTGPRTRKPVEVGKHSPKQPKKTDQQVTRTNQLLALLLTSLGRPIRGLLLSSWGLLNNGGCRNRNFFLRGREGRHRNDSRILNSCGPLHFGKRGVKNSGEDRSIGTCIPIFVLSSQAPRRSQQVAVIPNDPAFSCACLLVTKAPDRTGRSDRRSYCHTHSPNQRPRGP